jgi:hypothetical protein
VNSGAGTWSTQSSGWNIYQSNDIGIGNLASDSAFLTYPSGGVDLVMAFSNSGEGGLMAGVEFGIDTSPIAAIEAPDFGASPSAGSLTIGWTTTQKGAWLLLNVVDKGTGNAGFIISVVNTAPAGVTWTLRNSVPYAATGGAVAWNNLY